MQVDVLIIKKEKDVPVKNIGRIFRKYNIIEYKTPGDYLSINDFLLVTKELSKEENYWLKSLWDDLETGEEIQKLMKQYENKKYEAYY